MLKYLYFATISYAFTHRFPSELLEDIFAWILEEAVAKGYVDASTVFIDATHIKANANRKKSRKVLARQTARVYDKQLREEINQDRLNNGKKPLKDRDDDENKGIKQITVSTTDPECGLFHKGEHKSRVCLYSSCSL